MEILFIILKILFVLLSLIIFEVLRSTIPCNTSKKIKNIDERGFEDEYSTNEDYSESISTVPAFLIVIGSIVFIVFSEVSFWGFYKEISFVLGLYFSVCCIISMIVKQVDKKEGTEKIIWDRKLPEIGKLLVTLSMFVIYFW